MAPNPLPPEAWAVALSLLPGCGQHRLASVLAAFATDAEAAWNAVLRGAIDDDVLGRGAAKLRARWRHAAAELDVAATWERLTADGVGVWTRHGEDHPRRLADDPDPPPILFWRGDPQALERPSVAIVGTRRCTAYGTDVARSLGRGLASAGVAVVSGLALGIDGAAHEGALAGHLIAEGDGEGDGQRRSGSVATAAPPIGVVGEGGDRVGQRRSGSVAGAAPPIGVVGEGDGDRVGQRRSGSVAGAAPPIGVVGSGLDVVYPPRHRHLWERVAVHGLLLTESPPGAAPEPWRFPRRNRIIAALADLVVVVESHASGGSLSTVRAAIDRGVPVMAVPGSVRSPASAGTNRLLADGVAPVTDLDDVLVALSLEGVTLDPTSRSGPVQHDAPHEPDRLLTAVDWTPTSTEDILRRTGLDLPEASRRLMQLELAGAVRRRGAWWERVGPPR